MASIVDRLLWDHEKCDIVPAQKQGLLELAFGVSKIWITDSKSKTQSLLGSDEDSTLDLESSPEGFHFEHKKLWMAMRCGRVEFGRGSGGALNYQSVRLMNHTAANLHVISVRNTKLKGSARLSDSKNAIWNARWILSCPKPVSTVWIFRITLSGHWDHYVEDKEATWDDDKRWLSEETHEILTT